MVGVGWNQLGTPKTAALGDDQQTRPGPACKPDEGARQTDQFSR